MSEKKFIYLAKVFVTGLITVLIVSIMILSCVPPVTKDALVHHLALPKLYLAHGGMYEIPFMPFSYFPMNLDLLYLIPLYFGNDIIPKFIHFCFALLTAWLIFGYLKRRISTLYALAGVLLFLSIPIIVKLSISVYVDLGIIFFSTASLLLLLKWMEEGFRLKTLILSAFFCGLAMGTKYNGLVAFFLLTLLVPFVYSRYNRTKAPGFFKSASQGLIFFFVALLVFSPWMIRNYSLKKNPIYPLHNRFFNPPAPSSDIDPVEERMRKANAGFLSKRYLLYNETWWEIALLPVRIFFQGRDGDPRYFDGKMNPFLLIMPIFAFFRKDEEPRPIRNEKKVMLAFSVFFVGFALFSSVMRIRYISPIIPFLVILSVFGIRNIVEKVRSFSTSGSRSLSMGVVFLTLAFFLYLNFNYMLEQFRHVDPFSYLGGKLSRDEYIEKYVLEYPALRYINQKLPPESKLLFIFMGKRGYYCDKEYQLDYGSLYKIVKKSKAPEHIFLELNKMGITHLLIRYDIFDKWKRDIFSREKLALLNNFLEKYVKILFFKWGYGVSRLESPSE